MIIKIIIFIVVSYFLIVFAYRKEIAARLRKKTDKLKKDKKDIEYILYNEFTEKEYALAVKVIGQVIKLETVVLACEREKILSAIANFDPIRAVALKKEMNRDLETIMLNQFIASKKIYAKMLEGEECE